MKKRILGAIIIALILIPTLIIGGNVFTIVIGMIGVLAFKELVELKESHQKIPDFMFFIGILDLLLLIFSKSDCSFTFSLGFKEISFSILTILIPCLFYKNYNTKDAIYLIGSIIFLALVFNYIILLRNLDIWRLLYLVLIVTITDIFALIFGKLIGIHKCVPTISPGKTWEGSLGGTIVGTTIASMFYINMINNNNLIKVILLTLFLSILGQLGDLLFSKIKRENKIKDFGNLIPGHGGILDRIDSLIFVTLAYVILFNII